ncbi:MAG: pyridoxamine 5'-phosphate oxidase [Chitinophagales bacterium]
MDKNQLSINEMRQNYRFDTLSESEAKTNPFEQFNLWFDEVLNSDIREPNAMTIATVSSEGRPSARTVLLKGYNEEGFIFYTNYESRKGKELAKNPSIAILFFWDVLERQIRIEGKVELLSAEDSDNYFNSRPKGSKIGAIASPQSQVIPDRNIIEKNVEYLTEKYQDTEFIPRPEHWGGYKVVPSIFEFWQGRQSRLHDRLQYLLLADGKWKMERLAP